MKKELPYFTLARTTTDRRNGAQRQQGIEAIPGGKVRDRRTRITEVEFHRQRQEHSTVNAVRRVVMRAQRVRHCMIDAKSDIGEPHARNILRQPLFCSSSD